MELSKQEYWSGLPFLTREDLLNPGIKPMTLMSPALAGRFFTTVATWEAHVQRFKTLKKSRKRSQKSVEYLFLVEKQEM